MTAFLILCWVSCVIKPEEIEIFSVVDANLAPPPRRFLQGPTLAQKLVRINTQVQAKCMDSMDSGWDILFPFFEFLRKVFEFADKAQFEVHFHTSDTSRMY